MLPHGDSGYLVAGAGRSCAASPALRSGASHAQDRSRSPAPVMTTGLASDHALAPVARAAADNAVLSVGVPEDQDWFTMDVVLDNWVLKSVHSPAIRAQLALISLQDRKQIITSCMRTAHNIRNMNSYFAGCIRKSVATMDMRRTQTKSPPLFTVHSVEQVARPLMGTASPKCAEASVAFAAPSPASAAVAACRASPDGAPQAVAQAAAPTAGEASAHNDASTLAPWARTCMQHTGRKSMLVRSFCQQLERGAAAELQALPPTEASQVAIACCLAWEAPQPVSTLCRRLVRNYRELQQSQPLPTAPETASPRINLVILHLGGMGGVGHISMKAAFALVLKDLPAAKVSVLAMHVFAVGAQLSEVEKAAAEKLRVPCTVWSLADDFANVCSEHAATWGAKDCRVLVLINWDAVQAGFAVDAAARADAGGSSEPTAVRMSSISHSLKRLQEHVPQKNQGVLCMHRDGASAADEECLKSMLGAPHCVSCEGYAVPQSPWQVAATPLVQTIIGHSQGVAWPMQADGWQWAGVTGVSAASATSAKLTVDIFETIDAQVFA